MMWSPETTQQKGPNRKAKWRSWETFKKIKRVTTLCKNALASIE